MFFIFSAPLIPSNSNVSNLFKKNINIDENKIFDNPENVNIKCGMDWVIKTEEYSNGEEKTRLYYKKISDNRAKLAIIKRAPDGAILYDNEVTINDFSQIPNF